MRRFRNLRVHFRIWIEKCHIRDVCGLLDLLGLLIVHEDTSILLGGRSPGRLHGEVDQNEGEQNEQNYFNII